MPPSEQRLILRVPNYRANAKLAPCDPRFTMLAPAITPMLKARKIKQHRQRFIVRFRTAIEKAYAQSMPVGSRVIIRKLDPIEETTAEIPRRTVVAVLPMPESMKQLHAAIASFTASNKDSDMVDAGDVYTSDSNVSANPSSDRIVHGVSNSPLPPSVEAAYYQKCIDLKRRIQEIEGNNDKMHTTIERSHRAVTKLRLERSFLVSEVVRQMAKETGSEKSDSPLPTVSDLASNSPYLSCITIQKLTWSPTSSLRRSRPAQSAPASKAPLQLMAPPLPAIRLLLRLPVQPLDKTTNSLQPRLPFLDTR
jgi:hypothetical protein